MATRARKHTPNNDPKMGTKCRSLDSWPAAACSVTAVGEAEPEMVGVAVVPMVEIAGLVVVPMVEVAGLVACVLATTSCHT